ncbi:flagellar hook-basal body complex protein FliE [Marinobacter sp. R17]|uniref:flagellar hook-basal body complex protein FliE n=1 Tax=Marinobacter sp. R17 TaxID=2484250 RepID=UPI000F4C214C|nr:flagellar hook-basal body complex protein FliE [Marinobacter sp. R17]ROU01749.1 flagellar hook-basal body complex protein FliE [Marinobacter sp. R17]
MVQRADINNVLSEIRSLRSQMMQNQRVEQENQLKGSLDSVRKPNGPSETQEAPGFGDMLKQAVDGVNELQSNSTQLATAYEKGDPNVDIARVMIASQKASVSFEALTQVRNRVVQAYEDIMNMPV